MPDMFDTGGTHKSEFGRRRSKVEHFTKYVKGGLGNTCCSVLAVKRNESDHNILISYICTMF